MGSGRLSVYWEDISKLEINSILVDGIWGRRMPHPSAAFCEITSAWVHQFTQLLEKAGIHEIEALAMLDDAPDQKEQALFDSVINWKSNKSTVFDKYVATEGSVASFQKDSLVSGLLDEKAMSRLRTRICRSSRIRQRDLPHTNAELLRLLRIQTRLRVMIKTYAAAEPDRPDFSDRLELRKLWELKDGYIYAQNTFQVDGDVVTRISRRMYRDKTVAGLQNELMRFHQQNVETGLKNWQFLVETLMALGKAVGGLLAKLVNPVVK